MLEKIQEKLLINRVQKGEIEAFSELYDVYWPKIRKFFLGRVKRIEDAEDLASQVFVKILGHLQSGGSDQVFENFNAYLYKIARFTLIDHWRSNGTHEIIDLEELEAVLTSGEDTEEVVEQRRRLAVFQEVLNGMPPDDAEILTLRLIKDLSMSDIAKILDKNEGAVRVQFHRAKKDLRKRLEATEQKNIIASPAIGGTKQSPE